MLTLRLSLPNPALWERFLGGDPRGLPAPLLRCWQRARAFQLSPLAARARPVPPRRLVERREQSAALMRVAVERFAPLSAQTEGQQLLLLVDRDGVLIYRAPEHLDPALEARWGVSIGALWGEALHGTNGLGTALVEQRPGEVKGAAHYLKSMRDLVSCGVPVMSNEGELLGAVGAISPLDEESRWTQFALYTLAQSMEMALSAPRNTTPRGAPEGLLHSLESPALLMSTAGVIFAVNSAAELQLKLGATTEARESILHGEYRSEVVLSYSGETLRQSVGEPLPLWEEHWQLQSETLIDEKGDRSLLILFHETRNLRTLPRPVDQAPIYAQTPTQLISEVALLGVHEELAPLREQLQRLCHASLPLLLSGETGTGKGSLARIIHQLSQFKRGPFVVADCAAWGEGEADSILFGVDASSSAGLLEEADGGTLLVDSPERLSLATQGRLLRFLESGTYRRLNDPVPRRSRIRLITSSREDLQRMSEEERLLYPLYYRLCGAEIYLPPLRARVDLDWVLDQLLLQLCRRLQKEKPEIEEEARRLLLRAEWRGNLRELRHTLHRALLLCDGDGLLTTKAFSSLFEGTSAKGEGPGSLNELEARALQRALQRNGGNVSATARALGIARSTVYRLLQRYKIPLRAEDARSKQI
ncbi:MAG: sigma 54-interacting transcriptional regulator [Myxococcota bacterium]|nr:sigma 54-interacting transcriptional regulator [Myxococcota bacterium]